VPSICVTVETTTVAAIAPTGITVSVEIKRPIDAKPINEMVT
jgi:hypothetical protein